MTPKARRFLKRLGIAQDATLLAAMKRMDELDRKLLIVTKEGERFHSLLSIGDIQRAIIRGTDLGASVGSALRPTIKVCTVDDPDDLVRSVMLEYRVELLGEIEES